MPEAAAKIKIGGIEVPEALVRRGIQQKTQPTAVTAPVDNPLFKIVFSQDVEPEEKRKMLAAYLTFTGTKAEMRERMKAREEFEDYLEAERKRMQEELLRLTDTETFAVLQGVINDMNTDLLNFEDQMKPLTDILDAIYKLQVDGKAIEAFREIQNDRKDEAAREAERQADETLFHDLSDQIIGIHNAIAQLGEEKSWFGFGNVKETARKQIAVKNQELTAAQERLVELEDKLRQAAEVVSPTNLAEYAEEKRQLRNLLDISGPEHCQKVRELVDGALRFVKTSTDRIGDVRQHFDRMSDQMEHIKDVNGKMTGVRAVMSEAMTDSKSGTLKLHDELVVVPTDESLIAKIAREEKLEAVDEHVKALDNAIRTNTMSLTELTGEAITIRTARDEHQQMLEKTRILHTQGIAGVASRLNTTINALSMAALNESSKIAGQTLRRMIENTNETTQKEVVRSAMGVQDMTTDVQTVLGDLATLGETLRASSTIYRSGLSDLHAIIDKAKEITTTVQGDIKEAAAIHADTATGKPNGVAVPSKNGTTGPSPFGS
jgi:hypothetical protein